MSIFGKKGSDEMVVSEQAVIVELDGTGLPDEVYENYDLATLEDQLISAISGTGLGQVDGSEFGPTGAWLYLYGPDADRLYERIESTLKSYPLCQSAQVTIRYGEPGATQRKFVL